MEIKKFDKIEVPLLNPENNVETEVNENDGFVVCNGSVCISPDATFGIAQHDTKAGEIVTLFTKGNFVVSGC